LPTRRPGAAIAAYKEHKADRIVAEVNNGGEMVEATLRLRFASGDVPQQTAKQLQVAQSDAGELWPRIGRAPRRPLQHRNHRPHTAIEGIDSIDPFDHFRSRLRVAR
jgi:hypothetical protein